MGSKRCTEFLYGECTVDMQGQSATKTTRPERGTCTSERGTSHDCHMTLFVCHMNDIVCHIVHMQTGMDGIQFSFGIGAFPFAMMGGVSIVNNLLSTQNLRRYLSPANVSSVWEQTERQVYTVISNDIMRVSSP